MLAVCGVTNAAHNLTTVDLDGDDETVLVGDQDIEVVGDDESPYAMV